MSSLGVDPVLLMVGLLVGVFVLCLVWLAWLRDPRTTPSHPVTRSVWCPAQQRRATVEFIEEVTTGMMARRVTHCSLKETGAHCHEDCCFAQVRRQPADPGGLSFGLYNRQA